MVTGYLIEQKVVVTPQLATALLYGIESETTGYPREATSLDDGALIWLFPAPTRTSSLRSATPSCPRATSPRFRTHSPTRFYDDLVFSWCGTVSQPDIIAEIADFFIRFDRVNWSLAAGLFDGQLKISLRAGLLGRQGWRNALHRRPRDRHRRRPRPACRRCHRARGYRLGNRRGFTQYDPPSPARPAPYR